MDTPSSQLQHELSTASAPSPNSKRPLLTHLNADTSWLLQIPFPAFANSSRIYYNILIDPWFQGPQIDFGSWFSEQWHNTPTNIKTIQDVENLIARNEAAAVATQEKNDIGPGTSTVTTQPPTAKSSEGQCSSPIDLIVISHEFRDHCHHDTLLEASKNTPIFATNKAFKAIQTWSHFTSLKEIHPFTTTQPNWHLHSTPPLPSWLSISRLEPSWTDLISLHAALLITFSTNPPSANPSSNPGDNTTPPTDAHAEALIYTPHGILPTDVSHILTASPPLKPLALIHGLNDVKLGNQLNLGAHNGLKVVRKLGVAYWVRTHDERKTAYGIVGRFLRYTTVTFGEAVRRETESLGGKEEVEGREGEDGVDGVKFADLGVGEGVFLE